MTREEKLNALKAIVGDSDSDALLSTYLDISASKILAKAYPYNQEVTEVPIQYESLQIEIAVYLLNKRGAEGQLMHSENGVSRTYESADVPSSMLRSVIPNCGVLK